MGWKHWAFRPKYKLNDLHILMIITNEWGLFGEENILRNRAYISIYVLSQFFVCPSKDNVFKNHCLFISFCERWISPWNDVSCRSCLNLGKGLFSFRRGEGRLKFYTYDKSYINIFEGRPFISEQIVSKKKAWDVNGILSDIQLFWTWGPHHTMQYAEEALNLPLEIGMEPSEWL